LIGRYRRRLRLRSGECVALALHDGARDRLILIDASDESLARDVAQTVGCDVD
jgi:predicted nucleic acid-binding protein